MLAEMLQVSEVVEKMLSIKVCEPSVILVGSKICGTIRLDPRISRNADDSGSSLTLSKFTL